jgi:hypothetical protein
MDEAAARRPLGAAILEVEAPVHNPHVSSPKETKCKPDKREETQNESAPIPLLVKRHAAIAGVERSHFDCNFDRIKQPSFLPSTPRDPAS